MKVPPPYKPKNALAAAKNMLSVAGQASLTTGQKGVIVLGARYLINLCNVPYWKNIYLKVLTDLLVEKFRREEMIEEALKQEEENKENIVPLLSVIPGGKGPGDWLITLPIGQVFLHRQISYGRTNIEPWVTIAEVISRKGKCTKLLFDVNGQDVYRWVHSPTFSRQFELLEILEINDG